MLDCRLWLLFVLFFLSFCWSLAANETAVYTNGTLKYPGEGRALLAFRAALKDPRNVMGGWNLSSQPDLCLWNSIICNSDGHVIYLFIVKQLLEGKIPSSLSNLTYLRTLDLRQNNLSGIIPPKLAALPSLVTVRLAFNNLEGPIPSGFGRDTLRTLLLHYNKLNGTLPDSLWNCTSLIQLNLNYNNLSGTVSPAIGNLTSLATLRLVGNAFSGNIPSTLGNIPGLQFIGLANNTFNGSIPLTLCTSPSVTNVLLEGNELTGVFPSSLLECTSLVNLTLNNNMLSGTVPSGFINVQVLQQLTLNNNSFSGSLPTDLSSAKSLVQLDIHNNNFSGTFPNVSGFLNLVYVDLSENPSLGGAFPSGLLSATKLDTLLMVNNHFEGPFPSEITNLTSLKTFNFSGNYFNGTIPTAVQTYLGSSWPSLFSENCLRSDATTNCTVYYNTICFLPDQRPPTECLVTPFVTEGADPHTLLTALILAIVGAAVFVAILIGTGMFLIPLFRRETVRMQVKSVSVTRGGSIVSMKVTKGGGGEGEGAEAEKGKGTELVGSAAVASAAAVETKERDVGLLEPVVSVAPLKEGSVPRLSLEQIRIATDNFSMRIGAGSLGDTYQGTLRNGRVVAVKMLKDSNGSSLSDAEFLHEVQGLYKLQHPHLAGLLAYCQEGGVRAFVNQYISNGSLYDHLHEGRSVLSWEARMRAAVGASLGLESLHHAGRPHGDVKSTNILLTDDLAAKITDFSFDKAKLLGYEGNPLSSHVNLRGAFGYVDPDNLEGMEMSEKSDVYSFGVLLFELVTGRKALQEDAMTLVVWVQDYLVTRDRLPEMVDPAIKNSLPVEELEAVVAVAQACTRSKKSKRPTMNEVKNALVERLKISPSMAAPHHETSETLTSEDLAS